MNQSYCQNGHHTPVKNLFCAPHPPLGGLIMTSYFKQLVTGLGSWTIPQLVNLGCTSCWLTICNIGWILLQPCCPAVIVSDNLVQFHLSLRTIWTSINRKCLAIVSWFFSVLLPKFILVYVSFDIHHYLLVLH